MAKQIIDLGEQPNDGSGDPLRDAGSKINSNFTEIYTIFGNGTTLYNGWVRNGDQIIRLGVTSTAPASPVSGMVAYADGVLWNPAGSSSQLPYMVIYNGYFWAAANPLSAVTSNAEEGSVLVYKNNEWTATRLLDMQDITGGHY